MSATPVASFDEAFDAFLNFLQSPSPPAEPDTARDGLDGKNPDNTSIIVKEKYFQAKEQNHEGAKYKTVEAIKRCLEEKMDLKKYGEDLSKSEFKEFLLDATGILANDALLDAIYSATDKDKSGFLDSEELATYIRDIKPSTKKARTSWVFWACVYSPLPYLVLLHLTSGTISASTNLRSRPGGDMFGSSLYYYRLIAAILSLVGDSGYLLLKWEGEKLAYENLNAARARLIKWVHFDLPRFLDKNSENESDGQLSESADKTSSLEKMASRRDFVSDPEEKKRMDREALVSIRSLFAGDASDDELSSDEPSEEGDGLDIQEMRLMLETMGVFLAENALVDIFSEIDSDGGGKIDISELIQYAKDRQAMVTDKKQNLSLFSYLEILKRCCLTIGFWSGWFFVMADICWISYAVFGKLILLGLTCVSGLIGALGNVTNLYQSSLTVQRQIDNARMMLRAAAVAVGLAQMEKDKQKLLTEPTGEMGRPVHDKTKQTLQEMTLSVQNTIQQDALSKLKSAEASADESKSKQSLHQLATLASTKTLEVYSDKKLALAQEEGAQTLFQVIDVSDDENLDKNELHDALTELGVMIPTHVFDTLYKSIDTSGDGVIQLDEFIQYVSRIKPAQSNKEIVVATLILMVTQISFYIVLTTIAAGSLQVHATYFPPTSPPMRVSNMWLAGAFGWAIGGLYFLFQWPQVKGQFFDEVENARFMMKATILDKSKEFITEEDELAAANV